MHKKSKVKSYIPTGQKHYIVTINCKALSFALTTSFETVSSSVAEPEP
jgi:hypothetical protein